jgi:polar amino acid transport system permease protein
MKASFARAGQALRPYFLLSPSAPVRASMQALNWGLALLAVAAIFTFSFQQLLYNWNWEAVYRYRWKLLQGWTVTIVISLASLVLSTVLGVGIAWARRSRVLILRALAQLYVEGIRGTPLLVQLLVFFYVVADAFGISNRYLVGTLALSIFSSAYMSEMFRAGLESVGQSQLDSARAVGFTTGQTYRFVILPQALRQVLPPLAGQFASLIKDSSLLSVIAISELTLNAQEITSNTFANFECYGLLALGYLVLTLPISLWSRALEARVRYET